MWKQPNAAYASSDIEESIPFGGGSVMVWERVSHDRKLDLVTIQSSHIGPRYKKDILEAGGGPHSDNHDLATRPVLWTIMLDPMERVQ